MPAKTGEKFFELEGVAHEPLDLAASNELIVVLRLTPPHHPADDIGLTDFGPNEHPLRSEGRRQLGVYEDDRKRPSTREVDEAVPSPDGDADIPTGELPIGESVGLFCDNDEDSPSGGDVAHEGPLLLFAGRLTALRADSSLHAFGPGCSSNNQL